MECKINHPQKKRSIVQAATNPRWTAPDESVLLFLLDLLLFLYLFCNGIDGLREQVFVIVWNGTVSVFRRGRWHGWRKGIYNNTGIWTALRRPFIQHLLVDATTKVNQLLTEDSQTKQTPITLVQLAINVSTPTIPQSDNSAQHTMYPITQLAPYNIHTASDRCFGVLCECIGGVRWCEWIWLLVRYGSE